MQMNRRENVGCRFRFESLDVWQKAADYSGQFFFLADELDQKRYYRFAEQLRAATLSITNNIAEGSGSTSDKDFAHFLNIARRSAFETANMVLLFERYRFIQTGMKDQMVADMEELSKMLMGFINTLRSE